MTSFVTSQGSTTANDALLACENCCHYGLPQDERYLCAHAENRDE